LPQRQPIDAFLLAEKIVRAGDRFVIQASVEEIRALAEALLAQRALGEEEDVEATRAAPTAPVTLDTPIPMPPTLVEVVHDFLGAEAAYRRSPSLNLKSARDRSITPLRMHTDEPAVSALLNAFDALIRAEYSLAERHAQERFQAAAKTLSRRFSELVKEPANVEIAQG
jgi:hypothetical protein